MSAVSTTTAPVAYDAVAEVIARAIGPNDAYPSDAQLAAHRAKQALREKHFGSTDTMKQAQ